MIFHRRSSEKSRLRTRCEQLVKEYGLPITSDIDTLVQFIEGKTVELMEFDFASFGSEITALWTASQEKNYIFVNPSSNRYTRDHAIRHELAHIVRGSTPLGEGYPPEDSAVIEAVRQHLYRQIQTRSNGKIKPKLLGFMSRSPRSAEEEREAEMIACILEDWGRPNIEGQVPNHEQGAVTVVVLTLWGVLCGFCWAACLHSLVSMRRSARELETLSYWFCICTFTLELTLSFPPLYGLIDRLSGVPNLSHLLVTSSAIACAYAFQPLVWETAHLPKGKRGFRANPLLFVAALSQRPLLRPFRCAREPGLGLRGQVRERPIRGPPDRRVGGLCGAHDDSGGAHSVEDAQQDPAAGRPHH